MIKDKQVELFVGAEETGYVESKDELIVGDVVTAWYDGAFKVIEVVNDKHVVLQRIFDRYGNSIESNDYDNQMIFKTEQCGCHKVTNQSLRLKFNQIAKRIENLKAQFYM